MLTLALVVGPAVTWFLVRDVARRSQTALDQHLLLHAVNVRSQLHERELYLLEAAHYAANVTGMAEAAEAGDARMGEDLLRSVLALKADLAALAVARVDGALVAAIEGIDAGAEAVPWSAAVPSATVDEPGVEVVPLRSGPALALAVPICGDAQPCEPRAVAVVAMSFAGIAREAAAGIPAPGGVTIFGPNQQVWAASGRPVAPAALSGSRSRRRMDEVGGREVVMLYTPLEVQNQTIGSIATAIPAHSELGSARATAFGIGAVLLAAMAGLVGLGALLTRVTLRQVRSLVDTSRAIAGGDLSARAQVLAGDEVGELARSVNHMAGELQDNYETLEARVEAATAEVRRLLQERTEFFASLSHELRTPLAIILSEARMMLDPAYRRRGHDAAWRSVEGSASQLLEVVNAILELARAESGRLEVSLAEVDVPSLLSEVKPSLRGLAKQAGLALDVDASADLPPVVADAGRLRQVILNLVDNAVKYTPTGGRVRISASGGDGDPRVTIAVADDGPGVPSEARDRIFEPFYRVPSLRTQNAQPSTGLGLALCKKLVEAQNGTIALVSDGSAGATFAVAFPAARPSRIAPWRESATGGR